MTEVTNKIRKGDPSEARKPAVFLVYINLVFYLEKYNDENMWYVA